MADTEYRLESDRLGYFLKALSARRWHVLVDPLLRYSDSEVLGIRFSREPLLRHGQIDVPLGSVGRLGDGCHSRQLPSSICSVATAMS